MDTRYQTLLHYLPPRALIRSTNLANPTSLTHPSGGGFGFLPIASQSSRLSNPIDKRMFSRSPHLRVWFAFALGNNGLNAQKIPQTLCNGIFEVPLPLEDDWRVAVFPDRALIPSQYGHRGDARGTTAELVGRAIRFPAASAPGIIARHWIRKDPQNN